MSNLYVGVKKMGENNIWKSLKEEKPPGDK